MYKREQWCLHCTSQWGLDATEWACVLCGHTLKMPERVEQWICIRFCIKLEHFPCRNYSDDSGRSFGQLVISSFFTTVRLLMHHAQGRSECFGKTANHPGDSAPNSPDLAPCDFRLFLKLKSPLKGKRFQTNHEIQECMMGHLMVIGRTVWGPKVPTLKGTEVSLSCVQCFSCILYLLQSLCLFFILHSWMPSGQTLNTGQPLMLTLLLCKFINSLIIPFKWYK